VPSRLSCRGIENIVELALTDTERDALHSSAEKVRQQVNHLNQLLDSSGLML
jgi:malate dehydrogenase